MARHWREEYDSHRHRNRMWGPGTEVHESPDPHIVPQWVYFVRVCGFTFEFFSTRQLQTCLRFFEERVHPSSRLPSDGSCDHWETQRWFEKLPLRLSEESKRTRVVKALQQALGEFAG